MTRSVLSLGLLALLREGESTARPTREVSDCSLARLSEHDREKMQLHHRGLFVDPTCSQSDVTEKRFGNKLHCNMFDIGQNCRSCFSTCDGALAFLFGSSRAKDLSYLDIAFCVDSGIASARDCQGMASSTVGNSHRMPGSEKGNAKKKRWQKNNQTKEGGEKKENGAPPPVGFDHTREDWMGSPYPDRLLTSIKKKAKKSGERSEDKVLSYDLSHMHHDSTPEPAGRDLHGDFATTSETDVFYAYDFGSPASADQSYNDGYGAPGPERAPPPLAPSSPPSDVLSYPGSADGKGVDDGDWYDPDPTPSPAARGPHAPPAAGGPRRSPPPTAPAAPEMPVAWDYTMPVGPDPPQPAPSSDTIIGPATAPSAATAVPTAAPSRTPAVPTPTPTTLDVWHPFDPAKGTASPVVGDSASMPMGPATPVDTTPQAAPTPTLPPTIGTDDEERPNDDVDVVVGNDDEEDDDDGLWPDGPGDDDGDYIAGGSGSASSDPDVQEPYSFYFDFDFDFESGEPTPTPQQVIASPPAAAPSADGSYSFFFDNGTPAGVPTRAPMPMYDGSPPTRDHTPVPGAPRTAAPRMGGSYTFEYAEDEDENDELDCFGLLDPGAKEQLGDDQGVFHDKDCQGTYCNMFGVAQDCRRCYVSCAIREEDRTTADLYMCPSEHYPKIDGKGEEWVSACGGPTTGARRLRGG